MSDRLDDLVALALDDALDDATAAELDALLDDPALRTRALSLLHLEAALQSQRELPPALPRQVLDRLRSQRTSRVVRAVMTRVRRPQLRASAAWRRPLMAAACLLVLVLGGVVMQFRRPPSGAILVQERTGTVELAVGAAWRNVVAGERLAQGSRLRCGDAGALTLRWDDGTKMSLAAGSTATLSEATPARLHLDHGMVSVQAATSAAPRAEVATAEAACVVVGTRFTVQAVEGFTHLAVREGRVRLQSRVDERQTLIAAGGSGLVLSASDVRVSGFVLAEAATGTRIRDLHDGDRLTVGELRQRQLTIIAQTIPAVVGSVRLHLIPPANQQQPAPVWEEYPPYALLGDKKEDYLPGPAECRAWLPQPGRYRIEAQAARGGKGSPDLGAMNAITLEIVAP